MLRVGLTGGIACGKSSIAAMLVKRGAHFLQADGLAHQVYAPGTATYDEVVRSFGREILNEDGTINRGKLANLVFPGRISELNAIVHPEVVKRQNSWMSEVERSDPHGIAVVEAALLIEAGADKDFDKVIVVTCDFEQKVERFAQTNQCSAPGRARRSRAPQCRAVLRRREGAARGLHHRQLRFGGRCRASRSSGSGANYNGLA